MIDLTRLNSRLKARGISQAELARRVGLQQSTINLLFNGRSRSTTKLRDIARELKTTPEYLEGLTDAPDSQAIDSGISAHERDLIELTRTLPPEDYDVVTHIIRRLAASAQLSMNEAVAGARAATLHDRQLGFTPKEEGKAWG